MSGSFEKYSDVLLDAFRGNLRSAEIISKKQEILDELFDNNNLPAAGVIFVGFNPGILGITGVPITVTDVSSDVLNFLDQQKVKYQYISAAEIQNQKFGVVVAMDEYFTFAETDSEQKNKVDFLCGICNGFIITTLRDYKNQDFKEKEFSQPIVVKTVDSKKIYFEHYEADNLDRNLSLGTNYIIGDDGVTVVGPFARRNMFFKQLAKFSIDAGAKNFLVHKNLMHKSIIKKNYEHIITIRF
jgi:hypothetical protein